MTKKQESKPSIHSADDLIIKMEAEKLGKAIPEIPSAEAKKTEAPDSVPEVESKAPSASEEIADEPEAPKEEKAQQSEEQAEEPNNTTSEASDGEEVDEYGTKIGKPKLYTEEEVQSMIRKRLRDRHQDGQSNVEVQQAAKEFQPDPNSEESWEGQLEEFIDKTIQKRENKRVNEEWKRQEEATQVDFEIKFTEGMGKYNDFKQVVANKPITNAMMLATRSMKDPAAFVYAASKQHPKELERISQIKDVVTQATEIGRLEERMKKARIISSSPKPSQKIKGDTSSEMPQLSIESRIAAHAKSKIMSRK